ncbi:FixH family protein [Metabacillus arenae]|uniref:FixH family protein n=1 Tax=Metabacillus arenae TaxID=2771434 RepID=A0A926N9X4_9BACI|nr:FixH family protein [Metabacillus arenae]MBD1380242.1 FixH family protein [Metabacillus arenae]
MNRFIGMFFLMSILSMTAACGQTLENKNGESEQKELHILDVELSGPKKLDINQEGEFIAQVSLGEEKVNDADEVEFEIWLDGNKDKSEMVRAEELGEGKYAVSKKFDKEGTYTIQSHVTARDQHTMPKMTVQVGAGSPSNQSHGSTHSHEHGAVKISLKESSAIQSGTEVPLVVQINKNDKPLKGAQVRFEIWEADSKKHDWIDAAESEEEAYEGTYTFKEKGKYEIQIHVENNEGLHEHKQFQVNVK